MAEDDKLVRKETLERIRDRVVRLAKSYAPTHITNIGGTIVDKKGTVSILFQVPMKGHQEDARAQEYGSGLRKTRKGFKSKHEDELGILIKPVKKKVLSFLWERADKEILYWSRINHYKSMRQQNTDAPLEENLPSYAGPSRTDDRLMFNWVHHPGIFPYKEGGYMGSALKDTQKENNEDLLKSGMDSIVFKLRRNFTHLGKKK